MRKAKKDDQEPTAENDTTANPGDGLVRFRVSGEVVEFEPTFEKPILVIGAASYETWIKRITDTQTRARIVLAAEKMRRGLFGDWKDVGYGVFEQRLDFGPGYRVYYAKVGHILVVLLGGGDKGSQQRDIASAQSLWKVFSDEIKEI